MPGLMDDNLRRGYLKEELGIYLLRGFAAVAPVPRPQDIGIDAIATLLHRTDSRNLIAEDSFFVQLKSAESRKRLIFKGDELAWLKQLEIPYFVGSVGKSGDKISLYTSHNVSRDFVAGDYNEIVLHLTTPRKKTPISTTTRHIVLGPPVLQWTVRDVTEPTFINTAYNVMKPWIRFERDNIITRPALTCKFLDWETNEPPVHAGDSFASRFDESNTLAILERLCPYVQCWFHDSMARQRYADCQQIINTAKLMREHGVDPDFRDTWSAQLRIALDQDP